MASIKPIIRKNMIYVKRSLFNSILQLFYPCIFLGVFISINKEKDPAHPQEPRTYYDKLETFTLKGNNYQYDEIRSYDESNSYAVIGNDEGLSNELTLYITEETKICTRNCTVLNYKTRDDYLSFINSPKYKDLPLIISNVIEFITENNELNFRISSNNFMVTSQWVNLNDFNIVPDNGKLEHLMEPLEFNQLIMSFLLRKKADREKSTRDILFFSLPMKTPYLISVNSEDIYNSIIPVMFSITYISILFKFVLWMVVEKEKKLKDLLARQGISTLQYFLSWLYTFLILTIIPITINSFLLNYYFFPKTNFIFVFLNLFLFSLNILAMALVFHQFVDNVRSGQSLLKLVYFGVSIFSVVINRDEVSVVFKYLFSIFPQIVLKSSFEIFLQTKNFENGLDFHMMFAQYKSMNMFTLYLIYLIDFCIYFAFAFFIQSYNRSGVGLFEFLFLCVKGTNKKVSDYGVSKKEDKYDILLNKKDISEFNTEENKININININDPIIDSLNDDNNNNILSIQQGCHEAITNEDLLSQLQHQENLTIKNVVKKYDSLIAVNNLSCDLFKSQIFVLLGHNGAGKTSLIKIISGMEDLDNGEISLNSRSLITEKDFLFKNIGLCSQEDIFFDQLTVLEHLEIMCEIKGAEKNMSEINDLMLKIDLLEKKNTLAKNLSGGQKRKLCIALALIGNSKIILLDEPTSGMDVTAKRALWHFLKNYKENKIIILTTHSLDEAEYLGDRIGIMSEGALVCSGSSSFLKNSFSCGFNINFLVDHVKITNRMRNKLITELRKEEPKASVKVMSKETIVINFPQINQNCENVFNLIDFVKDELCIINYTLSTTSLEDVFLKLNCNEFSKKLFENEEDVDDDVDDGLIKIEHDPLEDKSEINSSKITFSSELKLNIFRHVRALWRNKKGFIIELLACSITFFVYIFFFKSFMIDTNSFSSFSNLISNSNIYYGIDPSIKDILKIDDKYFNSYFSNDAYHRKVNLTPLDIKDKSIGNYQDFDEFVFNNFYYHNIRAAFYIKDYDKVNDKMTVYSLYHPSSVDFQISLMNLIMSAVLKNEYKINSKLFMEYQVTSQGSKFNYAIADIFLTMISNFMLISAFINLSAYMIIIPLREKINNVKHLQYLSGVNMFNYWFSISLVDILKYSILILIIYPFLIIQNSSHIYSLIIVLMFIITSLLFTYNFSFIFETEENGQKFLLMTSHMSMFILTLVTIFSNKKLLQNDDYEVSYSSFIPYSSLAVSMLRLGFALIANSSGLQVISPRKLALNSFYDFCIQVSIYGVLLYILDNRIFEKIINKISKLKKNDNLDNTNSKNSNTDISVNNSYINSEREKVNNSSVNNTVKIKDLTKIYNKCCSKDKTVAVNSLCLGLEANEKFGLMGFNGSGKTTTFKSITDEITFDRGNIKLFGLDTQKQFETIRRDMGYCPQSNALFDYLTVEETFNFYIRLKIDPKIQIVDIDQLLKKFGLIKFRRTICANLSGGNKRKLNFAIALMNNPRIVLLDEPSTGVDPESRRTMWKNINDIPKTTKKFNMLLSTHSMEEAEILCDTIGWMKSGNFVCIGNPEKLKLQFSQGYYLHIKFRQNNTISKEKKERFFDEEEVRRNFKNISECVKNFDFSQIITTGKNTDYNDSDGDNFNENIYYYEKLDSVICKIKSQCEKVTLGQIDSDNTGSFEVIINVIPQKQGMLFCNLLKLKIEDTEIQEINLNMQSLENILTSL